MGSEAGLLLGSRAPLVSHLTCRASCLDLPEDCLGDIRKLRAMFRPRSQIIPEVVRCKATTEPGGSQPNPGF